MAKATPKSLGGLPLSQSQRARLGAIIASIAEVNPGRDHEANVAQAVRSFNMTVKRSRGKWVDVPYFRIRNGAGPVVVPSWARVGG